MPNEPSQNSGETLPNQPKVPQTNPSWQPPPPTRISAAGRNPDYERYKRPDPSTSPTVTTPPVPPSGNYVYGAPQSTPPRASRQEQRHASSARERARKRRGRSRKGGEWAWVVIAVALFAVVIVASTIVTLLIQTTEDGITVLPTAAVILPTAVDARTQFAGDFEVGQRLVLDDGRSITLAPWNGTSRFTILLMGLDRRPGETGLSYRTDTMMLVSLDPETGSLGILSIPRDLFVEIPQYGLQRVNSAMVLGEIQQVNYGPTLAMQTVQYNLGIRVHNYIAVDFQAVIDIINLIGGIEINVPYRIEDYEYPDMNFGYDPLILNAGLQHMDGETALKFARTRHGDSDFQRARRQQMVIFALRDQILNTEMLPQLVIQSPSLLRSFSSNVYTDLTLDQMLQLAMTLKDVSMENMQTGVIDGEYIMNYTTAQGAQVVVPRRAQLSQLLTQVFGENYSE